LLHFILGNNGQYLPPRPSFNNNNNNNNIINTANKQYAPILTKPGGLGPAEQYDCCPVSGMPEQAQGAKKRGRKPKAFGTAEESGPSTFSYQGGPGLSTLSCSAVWTSAISKGNVEGDEDDATHPGPFAAAHAAPSCSTSGCSSGTSSSSGIASCSRDFPDH
jgi:hypothetical protein